MPRSSPLVAHAALWTLALGASAALAGDIIVTTDGRMNGNSRASNPPVESDYAGSPWVISEENLDQILYAIEGVPGRQNIDTNRVLKIYHDPAHTPTDLTRGKALLDAGRFADARQALADVGRDDPVWAQQEAAFRHADTWWMEGDLARAAEALGKFKQQFPKSLHVPTATEHRARALLAQGKVADAKQEFVALRQLAGVPEDVAAQAEYWSLWIDERVATEKQDAAGLNAVLRGYDALATRTAGKPGTEAISRLAQVGRASVLITQGKASDAKQVLEKLAADTPAQQKLVLAAIHTKLGNALVREAAQSGTKEGYEQALLHYLRVVVLYGDEEGAEDAMAESLYHAGAMFRELRSATDKQKASESMSRARREWNELVARFPNSDWARRAKAEGAGN